MAKMRLTPEQRKKIKTLITAIGKDKALRERLQANPRAVFRKYGLAALLPAHFDFQITLGQSGGPVVVAHAVSEGTHWDIGHVDEPGSPGNMLPPIPHIDVPHLDFVGEKTGGTRFGIQPLDRL